MGKKDNAVETSTLDDEFAEGGVDFSEGGDQDGLMVDFNTVEDDAGFEIAPRGIYDCIVDELEFSYSKSSGNPMWTWILQVEGGEQDGKKFWFHTVFKGKALPRTKKVISRVAPQLLEGPFNPETIANEGSLIGIKVRARVDVKQYEGEPRNNVKDLLAPIEGGGGEGESFL